ncbi:MAG: hypothetical protein QMD04_09880 [Anaerolineales bacterium]|nr:hypothetical protein [Anaerolineales bacterium]
MTTPSGMPASRKHSASQRAAQGVSVAGFIAVNEHAVVFAEAGLEPG